MRFTLVLLAAAVLAGCALSSAQSATDRALAARRASIAAAMPQTMDEAEAIAAHLRELGDDSCTAEIVMELGDC